METLYLAAAIVGLLVGIPTVLKWGLPGLRALLGRIGGKESPYYALPDQTIKIIPHHRGAASWHMGSSHDQPAMQIVAGTWMATNITKLGVRLVGGELRWRGRHRWRPRLRGYVVVKPLDHHLSHGPSFVIDPGDTVEVAGPDFWMQPPLRDKGQSFVADVAILDQFNNRHWLRKVRFEYT